MSWHSGSLYDERVSNSIRRVDLHEDAVTGGQVRAPEAATVIRRGLIVILRDVCGGTSEGKDQPSLSARELFASINGDGPFFGIMKQRTLQIRGSFSRLRANIHAAHLPGVFWNTRTLGECRREECNWCAIRTIVQNGNHRVRFRTT